MKILKLFICIFICSFSLQSTLPHAEESFTKEGISFSQWVNFYYLNPQPEKISDSILFHTSSEFYKNTPDSMPMVAFYGAILKDKESLLKVTFEKIMKAENDNAKLFLFNILWFINSFESKELITAMLDDPIFSSRSEMEQWLKENKPFDIIKDVANNVTELDILWLTFFAAGDKLPIRKIVEVLEKGEGQNSANQKMIFDLARWTLLSNAIRHKRVYEILEEIVKEDLEATHPVLKGIIFEVQNPTDFISVPQENFEK